MKSLQSSSQQSGYLKKQKRYSKYWLDYLASLPKLFKRGDISRAYETIRFFSGRIVSSLKISEDLWLCSIDCGSKMEVVTNSRAMAERKGAIISYLPPRRFNDFISEGMFVQAEIEKMGELTYEDILSIKDSLGEVEAVLLDML